MLHFAKGYFANWNTEVTPIVNGEMLKTDLVQSVKAQNVLVTWAELKPFVCFLKRTLGFLMQMNRSCWCSFQLRWGWTWPWTSTTPSSVKWPCFRSEPWSWHHDGAEPGGRDWSVCVCFRAVTGRWCSTCWPGSSPSSTCPETSCVKRWERRWRCAQVSRSRPSHASCVSGRDWQRDVHHQAGGGPGGGGSRPADRVCHHQSWLGVRGDQVRPEAKLS